MCGVKVGKVGTAIKPGVRCEVPGCWLTCFNAALSPIEGTGVSLAGPATSVIFVATNTCLSRQNTSFVVTEVCLSRQNL